MLGLSGLAGGSSAPSATGSLGVASSSLLPATAGVLPSASQTASPSSEPTPTQVPSPSPDPTPTASAASGPVAPTSAEGFALRKTAIDIAFPFRATVKYRYSDAFLDARVGVTRRYNHARGVSASGRLLRAHDGLDLRAKRGTRVYAGFSGTVIDPAERWKPWDPGRYGKVVAIVSDEPTSPGYVAIYAHLASTRVKVGDRVERGAWIGRVGNTGNAAAEPPQLHFELRAPFRIPVREGGRNRRIDAFDPYPSLIVADPNRPD
jgi:murein DD-endopeptidase MepM/ murein hydrolase activator NlpD